LAGSESSFGKQVRELRRARNLTQSDVARRIKSPRTYLSKLERGKLSPYPAKIKTLANALGVSATELFDDKYSRRAKVETVLLSDPLLEILSYLPKLTDWQRAHVIRAARQPWRLRNAS
jgi:transcriptional regulator with XRE-family HTH domain